MNLQGQGRVSGCVKAGSERGYAMAALLVALAMTAVLLTVAMPVWVTAARREREAELVWRGGQYARAVSLFRRKYANASPPSVDVLINERFLRKKYKDPMTKEGEFQLVFATDQAQRPGEIAGANPQPGRPAPRQTPSTTLDPQGRTTAGARGGVVGVVSKSTERGIRMFNGRTKYNEWQFTPETLGIRVPGGAGGNTPGGVPGGAPGQIGPGGQRGTPSTPGRGPLGLGGFGRSSPNPPGAQLGSPFQPRQPGQINQPGQPAPGQPGQPPPQRPFGLPSPQRPPG